MLLVLQVNKPAQFRPGLLSFFFRKELQVIDIHVPLLHELQCHDMDAFGEINLGEVPADPPPVPVAGGWDNYGLAGLDAIESEADFGVLVV